MSQSNDLSKWTLVDCLLISFFSASIPLMWVPLTIYLANTPVFMIGTTELSLWLAAASVLGTLVLMLPLLLLPNRLRPWGGRFVFAVGILLWVQANLFVWRTGVLDGSELIWSPTDIRGIIDAGTWFVLLPTILMAARWCRKYVRTIAVTLIAVQLAATLFVAVKDMKKGEVQGSITIDESKKFIFSPERNVVILVLDSFNTMLFYKMLESDPTLADKFDGFTYYPNIVGGYQSTCLAMPLIMTGQYFDNLKPYPTYIKDAYSGDSLPRILKSNGFRSEFYTSWDGLTNTGIYVNPSVVDNIIPGRVSPQKTLADLEVLFATTLFRSVPYWIKISVHERLLVNLPKAPEEDILWVYQEPNGGHLHSVLNLLLDQIMGEPATPTQSLVDRDVFTEMLNAKACTTSDRPVFKYYHLVGTHPPLSLNGVHVRDSSEAIQQVAHILIGDLVSGFLDKLKALGIYDNSVLYVLGDHGRLSHLDVRLPELYASEYHRGRFVTTDARMGQALPLFLYKPMHARGTMQTSMAPVTLADIVPTEFESMGLQGKTEGIPLQQLTEDTVRERRFFAIREYKLGRFMAPMEEYRVNGFSWLDKSWHETGFVYADGKRANLPAKQYALGTTLYFGKDGNVLPFLSSGWDLEENSSTGHRARGAYAKLRIPIEGQKNDLTLSVQLSSLQEEQLRVTQPIHVFVNEQELAVWNVDRQNDFQATIPKALTMSGDLNICFEFSDSSAGYDSKSNEKNRLSAGLLFTSVTVNSSVS